MKCRRILPVIFSLLVLAALTLGSGSLVSAQGTRRVGLVVQYLDGTLDKRCVEVGGTGEIKGRDVLQQSGLDIQFEFNASVGSAVCKIGQDGCQPDNCFCDMPNYWSYWHLQLDDNTQWRWMYSQLGASNYVVTPGQVEGWRYGAGQPPEQMPRFEDMCAPSTPTSTLPPTATLTLTATPPPPPTNTLPPTAVAMPTAIPTSPPPTATSAPVAIPPPPLPSNPIHLVTLVLVSTSATPTETATIAPPTATLVQPSATHTLAPSASPTSLAATSTSPLPAPTETDVPPAVAVAAIFTSEVHAQPPPSATATLRPTEKPRWGRKTSATPSWEGGQVPAAQSTGSNWQASALTTPAQVEIQPLTADATAVETAAVEAVDASPPSEDASQALGLMARIAGGLAGTLVFFGFFVLLSVSLIVVLVSKRR